MEEVVVVVMVMIVFFLLFFFSVETLYLGKANMNSEQIYHIWKITSGNSSMEESSWLLGKAVP